MCRLCRKLWYRSCNEKVRTHVQNLATETTHLVSEEAAADVDLFASNNDNFLTREDLLGENGSKASQEMALTIDDDGRGGERRHYLRMVASQIIFSDAFSILQ